MAQGIKSEYGGTKVIGLLLGFVGGLVIIGSLWGAGACLDTLKRSHELMQQQIAGVALGFSALAALFGLLLAGAGRLINVTVDIADCNRELLARAKE